MLTSTKYLSLHRDTKTASQMHWPMGQSMFFKSFLLWLSFMAFVYKAGLSASLVVRLIWFVAGLRRPNTNV